MWFDLDTDIRIDDAETTVGETITTYRDETGTYPALTECLKRVPWRDEREGKLYEPLAETDGYDRTTDRPEVVDWYARKVGALKHDQIAQSIQMAPSGREYEPRESQVLRQFDDPVIAGERLSPEKVLNIIRDYRGYLSQDTLKSQAKSDCLQMGLGASLHSTLDLSSAYTCYAEYRTIGRLARDGGDLGPAGLGCTIDAAIEDEGRPLAVEVKTGRRILQRHRAQATVQARMVHADPVLVHFPLGREPTVYTPETDDKWHARWRYWERIAAEAVMLFERL